VKLLPLLGCLPVPVQLLLEMPSGVDQALLHVIEGGGKPSQLVAGVDLDSPAEVAVGDPDGALMEAIDPPGDMSGDDDRDADAHGAEPGGGSHHDL